MARLNFPIIKCILKAPFFGAFLINNIMTDLNFFELEYYSLGLALGIVGVDELSLYVDSAMEHYDEIPDLFLDLFSAVVKGADKCIRCISDFFFKEKYTPSYSTDSISDEVFSMLVRRVGEKYHENIFSREECCYKLFQLNAQNKNRFDNKIYELELLFEYRDIGVNADFDKKVLALLNDIFKC